MLPPLYLLFFIYSNQFYCHKNPLNVYFSVCVCVCVYVALGSPDVTGIIQDTEEEVALYNNMSDLIWHIFACSLGWPALLCCLNRRF